MEPTGQSFNIGVGPAKQAKPKTATEIAEQRRLETF
jgi:hypothetical protein